MISISWSSTQSDQMLSDLVAMFAIRSWIFTSLQFWLCFVNIEGQNGNYSPSIIIVGAGPAGIAAAAKLLENNIKNITILEAEGRVGGRIHSVEFGDAVVDLGAEWCHGKESNIVYELVKDFDLLKPGRLSMTLYHSSQKYVDPTFGNEMFEIYNNIYKVEKIDSEMSLGQYVAERYNKTILDYFGEDDEKLKLAFEGLDVVSKWILGSEGAFSLFDPSAQSDYMDCEGNVDLIWKGQGYRTILDVLTKKYPDPRKELPVNDKIMLNKEVIKIVWDSNRESLKAVTVECSDGSVHSADHVILTASLGVLKDQYKTLFQPSLPEGKRNAIEMLGIGAVGKVLFHFPHRWWDTGNFTDFTFLWSQKDLHEFLEDPNKHGKSWITNIVGFYPVEKNPNVLEVWLCGEFVPQFELCSDEMIVDGAMLVLNKFVGHLFHNITQPDALVRYNWYSNPHFRGTYSYQTVASRKEGISQEVVLGQPLMASHGRQTLLFAGEATHPFHYSTVHGAIETGFREADRIINFYK